MPSSFFFFEPAHGLFRHYSRIRRITVGFHRLKVGVTMNPNKFFDVLVRSLAESSLGQYQLTPSEMWCATLEEVQAEAVELASLRGLKVPQHVFDADSLDEIDLTFLQTDGEAERLEAYEKRYEDMYGGLPSEDPECVFFLGDDPRNGRCSWSCSSGKVSALRHQVVSLTWSPYRKRHMTAKEKLVMSGFPATPIISAVTGWPLFESLLSCRELHSLMGNGVHCSAMCLMCFVALVCSKPRTA